MIDFTERELHAMTLASVISKSQAKLRRVGLTGTEYDLMEMAIVEYEHYLDAAETSNLKIMKEATIQMMGSLQT
jgi:hypothetical protein